MFFEQFAIIAEEAPCAALLHQPLQHAHRQVGLAQAGRAHEKKAIASGVGRIGFDKLAGDQVSLASDELAPRKAVS